MASGGPKVTLTFAGEDNLSRTIDKLEAKIAALEAKMDAMGKGFDEKIGKLNTRIAELGDKAKKSGDDVDKGLVKKLQDAGEKAGKFADGMQKAIRPMLLLSAAGSVVPILSGIAGSLVQLAPAALLLPGALLAGAAAMETFKLATKGFGDAVKAGLSGNMAKFAKDTKDMAPAMREAAQAVVALKGPLTSLRQDVQAEFWDGFAGQVKSLAGTYLPILDIGLSNISRSLGTVALSALDATKTPFFTGAVTNILNNTSDAVAALGGTVGDVLTAFVGLGQVGTSYLPRLTTAIASGADSLRSWVTWAVQSGAAMRWIDSAIAGFKDLWTVVVHVGQILGSIFTGLGGTLASPLASLRQLTGELARFLATAQAQDALHALGTAIAAVGQASHGILFAALQALVPILIAVAPLVTAFANAVAHAAPALGPLALAAYAAARGLQGIGAAAKAFKGIQEGWQAAQKIVKAFQEWEVATKLVTAAQWLLDVALNANPIGIIVFAIGALISALVLAYTYSATFRNVVNEAWTTVKQAVGVAVDFIKGALAWFEGLPARAAGWFGGLGSLISGAFGSVVGFLTGLPATIGGAMATVGTAALTGLSAFLTWLAALPGRVLGFLMQLPMMAAYALGYLAGLVYLGALKAWSFLTTTLPQVIGQVLAFLASLPVVVAGALVSLGSSVFAAASSAWNWLYSTVVTYGSAALVWIGQLPGRVGAYLANLAATVATAAQQTWTNFLQTTANLLTQAWNWVAQVPGRVGAFLSSLPGIVIAAASAAWNGFRNATIAGANAVMGFVASIPGRIQSFFSAAGSWLYNAGAQIVQGLWNGLRNAANAVLGWIADLGRQIAAGFAAAVGIHSPSTVFIEHGLNIGRGLVVGLERSTPAAVGASAGMASSVSDGARAALAGAAPPPAAPGTRGGTEVRFVGNTSDALATVIMQMVRTGKIQIA